MRNISLSELREMVSREIIPELDKEGKVLRGKIVLTRDLGLGIDFISRVGRAKKYILSHLDEYMDDGFEPSCDEDGRRQCKEDMGKDKGEITVCGTDIKTLEQAIEHAEVDLNIWEVSRYVKNSWPVTMREPATTVGGRGDDAVVAENEKGSKSTLWTRGNHKPVQVMMTQFKMWMERKVSQEVENAIEILAEKVAEHAPRYKFPKLKKCKDPHLLVMSLVDHHFGKLAWRREVGEDFDLSIAENIYDQAGEDLLNLTSPYQIDRILFPVGHDFFHINDDTNMTPRSGNKLDVEGRLAKIYETGANAVIKMIERCAVIAPVDVIFVPGNHDSDTGFFLAMMIDAWFRKTDRVTVDKEPMERKKYIYGNNLLGMIHLAGNNNNKLLKLLGVMATTWPREWSDCPYREWLAGHQHRKQEIKILECEEDLGLRVRWLPSLTATDRWHYSMQFVNSRRAAESMLYHKDRGYVGQFSVMKRDN